jgi:L-tyrosine isonitrile synthase
VSERQALSVLFPASEPLSNEHGDLVVSVGSRLSPRTSFDRSFNPATPAIASRKVAPDKILQSFNTWHFKREQPSDPRAMLEIISEAISVKEPIPFVLYWGKGPRCRLAEPDIQCLDFLAGLAARVRQAYEPGAAVKLIFTDTHAKLNGHSLHTICSYFADVDAGARQRGFESCWLSALTRVTPTTATSDPADDLIPEETLLQLCVGAMKWYHGEGTPEEGALRYYRLNMVERRAVELTFPRSIFVTFNGSKFRGLFPRSLPVFYMYSLRRGVSVKPWFLPADAPRCEGSPCRCTPCQH